LFPHVLILMFWYQTEQEIYVIFGIILYKYNNIIDKYLLGKNAWKVDDQRLMFVLKIWVYRHDLHKYLSCNTQEKIGSKSFVPEKIIHCKVIKLIIIFSSQLRYLCRSCLYTQIFKTNINLWSSTVTCTGTLEKDWIYTFYNNIPLIQKT
jgi:hypothetical protein